MRARAHTHTHTHTHTQIPVYSNNMHTHIENVIILTSEGPMMIFFHTNKNIYKGLITKKKLFGKAYTRNSSQTRFNLKFFFVHHHKKK
jgi:hypothetical protein